MRRLAVVVVATLLGLGILATAGCAEIREKQISRSVRNDVGGVPAANIRAEVRDILSAPEYNRKFKTEQKSWLNEFVTEKLQQLLAWLARGLKPGSGDILARLLAIVVIAAFLGLCILLAIRLARRARTPRELDGSDVADGFDLPSSSRLMWEASRLANEGDFRGAFLRAYLGSISYLDENQKLRFERSRTNWEYLRELRSRGHDSLAAELRPITSDFDRKLYGHDHCTRQDYDKAVQTYDQVRQMAA